MFVLRKEGQTKEEALRWKTEFEDSAQTTFRVSKTYGENSEKIIFKKKFHCIHNIFPKPSYKGCHEKHTKRQARLDLLVKPQMKRWTISAHGEAKICLPKLGLYSRSRCPANH
ncbi:uncharacterized protein LOC113471023 [Diaphorina citri]|uniref:Uncharacterized protein LOC113471023 n=1 Tax=Diaphorina citri TaxID=121845 RepID=A0A3Q0JF66_DIACI|nr:uncharacterized protein LOC113471023 [Diaphorina citri]